MRALVPLVLAALALVAVPVPAAVVHPCNVTDLFHLHVGEEWNGVTTRVVGAGEVLPHDIVGEGLGKPASISKAEFQGQDFTWRIATPAGTVLASGAAGDGVDGPLPNPHGGLCLEIEGSGPGLGVFAFEILHDDPW